MSNIYHVRSVSYKRYLIWSEGALVDPCHSIPRNEIVEFPCFRHRGRVASG